MIRFVRLLATAVVAVALSLGAATPARADDAANVILAKSLPDVVLIWKTNDALDAPAARAMSRDDLYAALLARAEALMIAHARGAANRVTIRLVYFHDAHDPRYKIQTLSGVDRLGSLSATADDLRRHGAQWQRSLAAHRIPSGLTVDVARAGVVPAR